MPDWPRPDGLGSRNCRRIILQNFYGTLVIDTIGIGLAAAGLPEPASGGIHPCRLGTDLHPELDPPACSKREESSLNPGSSNCSSLIGCCSVERIHIKEREP